MKGVRDPKNGAGNVTKNFGWEPAHLKIDQKSYPSDPPPTLNFALLLPDSEWVRVDGIGNNRDGGIDEADEAAFFSDYSIGYYYQVEYDPNLTTKVAGSGAKWRKNFFYITSITKRQNLDNATAEIEVTASKILASGY